MKQKTPPLGKDVFAFAFENKRYHTLAYENRLRGYKLHKAVIDAGFTCPNLDGTRGTGGCIFCSGGSGYFTAPAALSIEAQLARELERLRRRDPRARAAAYFQAHTNTYAPAAVLRDLYERALACPGIESLAIATRPDTLPQDVLDLLEKTLPPHGAHRRAGGCRLCTTRPLRASTAVIPSAHSSMHSMG